MTHFHFRHLSPELARLLLACAVSITLICAIYLADLSFWQRGSIASRARLAPPISPAASAEPAPVGLTGSAIALSEPPVATEPVVQASPQPEPLPRYTVKPGDSLTAIGLFFGARNEDLIALNALPADGFLYAGQELLIPRGPLQSPASER